MDYKNLLEVLTGGNVFNRFPSNHNSVRFGKQSRFSRTAICWPISVRVWRFGKYSMPIILGKPEKNISNLVTFFPDPFCSLSNFTPFIVHWQKKKTTKKISVRYKFYCACSQTSYMYDNKINNKFIIYCKCIYIT